MAFYKRRHDAVQAQQLTKENAEQVAEWCGGRLIDEIHPHTLEKTPGINFPTFDGTVRASMSDYIVKNNDGTFSRWSQGRFEHMYELIQI